MKLRFKLIIYNALSKALIVLAFGALLPLLAERVVYNHIDQRLNARMEKLLTMVYRGGINEITLEQDCSFENYDILKEEFLTIGPLDNVDNYSEKVAFENRDWELEGESLSHRVLKKNFKYDNQWYEINVGEGISTVEGLNEVFISFTIIVMILVTFLSVLSDIGFVQVLLKPFYQIVNTKLRNVQDPTNFPFDRIQSSTYEFDYLDKSINELMMKIREAFLIEKEFIANVSHELLTPISILNNRLENIVVSNEADQELTQKIVESQKTLSRLNKIIKALLLISKIENAQYIKSDKVEITNIVDEVLDELEDRIEEKKLVVENHIDHKLSFYPSNKSLIFTMIFNVINNAVKYNKENGSIKIEISDRSLLISNTGIGIPNDQISKIFNRFQRFQDSDTTGYGLGLPIVKKIADFHSISIAVTSEVNTMTCFEIKFPEGHLS